MHSPYYPSNQPTSVEQTRDDSPTALLLAELLIVGGSSSPTAFSGGHRVPGIIAWPAVVGPVARESWDTVITSDFLPTIMDILKVSKPLSQAHWQMDGVSILPILRGEPVRRNLTLSSLAMLFQIIDLSNACCVAGITPLHRAQLQHGGRN